MTPYTINDLIPLKDLLLSRLEECKDFLGTMAVNKNSALKEVLDIPFDDLPQHINEKGENKREMVLARLRKEDIRLDHNFVCQSLWDVEFDSDEYKNIGWNDGTLATLRSIFEVLGDEEHQKECTEWIYSDLIRRI